jgi:uncharacterized protein YecE (DUF72 family)
MLRFSDRKKKLLSAIRPGRAPEDILSYSPAGEKYGYFRPTDEVFSAWEKTEEIARILKARVIVFQCPGTFRPTDDNKENLRRFFSSIKGKNYLLAWEPRGKWEDYEIKVMCDEFSLIHCVDPFKNSPVSGEGRYFRLQGRNGHHYKYSDEDLGELKEKTSKAGSCYCLFNNVAMWQDAQRFKELLGNSRG